MKLDFIIIGGQKCASTFLQEAISKHPETDMLPEECPHLESPDFENGGLEKLQERLDCLAQNKLIGIKRPNYLCKTEVPERIYGINPQMKLIAILRNPLERFKSAYFHQMGNGTGPLLPLEEGAKGILKGDFGNTYPRTSEVVEFGLYGKYLEKYLFLFKDTSLILTFDELKADNRAVIKKCYTFLGIDDSFVPTEMLDNRPQKVNYSLNSAKLRSLRNNFRYHYNSDKTRFMLKKQNIFDKVGLISIRLMDKILFETFFTNSKKPGFSPEIRKKLLAYYLSDIERMEHLLNRNLTAWKV